MAQAFKSNHLRFGQIVVVAASTVAAALFTSGASAQSLNYAAQSSGPFSVEDMMANPSSQPGATQDDSADSSSVLPERLRRAVVAYNTREAPGTVIIDTANTSLYYVLGDNRAIRYGVGVGREGFTWSGTQTISRKAEWPDWHPPAEMIARQPYLPRFMAGGPGNPLGARAMYLGASEYRIHGTNDPTTIGKFVSSGCIRLTNTDIEDLFSRVQVGAKVVVLPKNGMQHFEASSKHWNSTASRNSAPVLHSATARAPERQAMNLTASSLY